MKSPFVLLCIFATLSALGLLIPDWSDLLLVSLPCVVASLWLLWRAWRSNEGAPERPEHQEPASPPKSQRSRSDKAAKWVILDGSNVMHWMDGTPSITPLLDVLERLKKRGFTAGVMFDANAGYKLFNKHLHDQEFSKLLGVPEDRIMVVPSQTPADPYILTAARDYEARIVTNDRFRDWADEFPEVHRRGFLVRGKYKGRKLQMHLD